MIVSELKLYNFRKFKSENDNPGLTISFHKGLNALVGENDSGKTAVIDALKLVLLTQSNEYIRPTDDDFYMDKNGQSVNEFKIDCTISDFSLNEAKNFIEYLDFKKEKDNTNFFLHLHYRAWKSGTKIFQELRIGDVEDGIKIDGKARELLKAVYLKPLRDAEREMNAGRNSRFSQILLSLPEFRDTDNHKLIQIFQTANESVEEYFTEDEQGKTILDTLRTTLEAFNEHGTSNEANIVASAMQLKAILEKLSLDAPEVKPGLGELNLLFIAAELLLLNNDTDGGMRLALIEELEAHLHPQAQLRLIDFLQNEYNENGAQIIISTHSPTLASKINLKNLILMKDGKGYDMTEGKTMLEKGDYLFLQRFLDSTKSNLFFAKGIIMVEGDAENILLPVIADIIGYPLEKYGISIVNVGGTAFLRYARIMVRKDGSTIGIPVALVTDCDIRPCVEGDEGMRKVTDNRLKDCVEEVHDKEEKYAPTSTKGPIKAFVSPRWTLEYCIALSCLQEKLHKAIHYAEKIKNSNSFSLTNDKITAANMACEEEQEKWKSLDQSSKAYNMYELMLDNSGKSGLKAITAQCLASIIKWETSIIPEGVTQEQMFDLDLYSLKEDSNKVSDLRNDILTDEYLKYIVDGIKHAAGE